MLQLRPDLRRSARPFAFHGGPHFKANIAQLAREVLPKSHERGPQVGLHLGTISLADFGGPSILQDGKHGQHYDKAGYQYPSEKPVSKR